jgi:drug/metabolite transporter (DMT)-like permease
VSRCDDPVGVAAVGLTRGKPVAWLLLSVTSLCWGANAVFARLAVGEVSPMALVTLRWLFVVSILAVIARGALARDWAALRPHRARIMAMGALGFTLFNALFYVAAHHTTAINLGIIQAVMPVFVFMIAFARFGVPVTSQQMLGVVAAIIGVLFVAARGEWRRLVAIEFNPGDLLMIAGAVLYAGYTVALRSRPAVSPLAFFTVMAGAAFVTSIPLLAFESYAGDLLWPTGTGWLLIGAIALFPSLLGQLLFIRGVEIIGPGRAGLFINLTPVLASVMAVLFLGEQFRWFHAAALALVFAGIWLSEREGIAEAGRA